jgi:hypothetical protein
MGAQRELDRARFLAWVATLAVTSCAGPRPAAPTPPPATAAPEAPTPATAGTRTDELEPGRAEPAANGREPGQAHGVLDAAPAPSRAPSEGAGRLDCVAYTARPGPACEGLDIVRADCEAVVHTLEPAVARRVLDCARSRRDTRALCGFAWAECLKDELDDRSLPTASDRACSAIATDCAERRARQMQSPSAQGVIQWPWLVSEQQCVRAFAFARPEIRADLGQCLLDGCHPTACFSSDPMSIVARLARKRAP